ncbi:hypothetical protein N0824_02259 [Microcystis sp. 0824]|nr:hypothetical protein N0824_02259 [Microcystis sp. 0824]
MSAGKGNPWAIGEGKAGKYKKKLKFSILLPFIPLKPCCL